MSHLVVIQQCSQLGTSKVLQLQCVQKSPRVLTKAGIPDFHPGIPQQGRLALIIMENCFTKLGSLSPNALFSLHPQRAFKTYNTIPRRHFCSLFTILRPEYSCLNGADYREKGIEVQKSINAVKTLSQYAFRIFPF